MDGFKPYSGGEELRRAIAALAGPSIAQEREVRPSQLILAYEDIVLMCITILVIKLISQHILQFPHGYVPLWRISSSFTCIIYKESKGGTKMEIFDKSCRRAVGQHQLQARLAARPRRS